MSADNGLLVKKNSEGSFDVYYLVADNQFYENTLKDLETLIRWIQEQQENFILEYGTRFAGF